METDPHGVLEGVALAAYAVGATRAYVAVRTDATVAVRRLAAALRDAEEAGLLGVNALGKGIELQIELRELQGAFVVGEETVLLRAIEGKRAMPDQRPPYPVVKGLWDEPTVVNNVATLASVPWIVTHGAGAFRKLGAADEPGTILVHVTGQSVSRASSVPTGPLRPSSRPPAAPPASSRRSSSAGPRAASCRQRPSTRPTGGRRSTRPGPSSGRAASWSWTRGPASSSWPRSWSAS
jgi:hypothetical protein